MSCPLRPLRFLCSAVLGLAAVLGGGACAGTPLPEPPDAFPRPELAPADLAGQPGVAMFPPRTEAVIRLLASTVPAGAEVTVLNLDAPSARVSMRAPVDAGVSFTVLVPASPGDRLRVLFTSDRGHSPPLDLAAQMPLQPGDATLPTALLGDTSLPCLRVEPRESLVLSGRRGQLTLTNTCEVAVELARAALLTGAEGLQLAPPPSAPLAPGARTALTLEDVRGPGPSERLDVLLLDVSAADGQSGRYAIDVFSALQ